MGVADTASYSTHTSAAVVELHSECSLDVFAQRYTPMNPRTGDVHATATKHVRGCVACGLPGKT